VDGGVMPELLHEYWEGDDHAEFAPVNQHNDALRRKVNPNARLVFVVRASSWFQALQLQYDKLGYGKHHPPEGIPDVVYSEQEMAEQVAYLRARNLDQSDAP
jgi:hypothetical protein